MPPRWPCSRLITSWTRRPLGTARQSVQSKHIAETKAPPNWFAGAVFGIGLSAAIFAASFTYRTLPSKISYADRPQMLKAAKELVEALGQDAVSFDEDVIEHHGHSEWSTSNTAVRPVAVVYPKSTNDVVAIAQTCNKYKVPIVPFGAGSSVEGNFSSPHSGICVDFSLMDQVIAFRPEDMDVTVQPGVNWVDLNNQIAASGLFLPLDPSPTAQIGGMVSTNCSGTNAMRYGTMKDWVVNLTVVLADGTIIKTRRRPRKTSAGYNLTSLFVGAEGTLGLVTEATLKLAPIPEDTSVAIVSFPTIKEAATAASSIIRSGIQLAALELMDDLQMQIVNRHGSASVKKRKWLEEPTLFLKFSGTTDAIKSDIKRVSQLMKPHNPRDFIFAQTPLEKTSLWAARKEALFTMLNTRPPGTEIWSTDVAVPLSQLANLITLTKQDCSQLNLFASIVGHVGDANFHTAILYDPRDAQQTAAVGKVVKQMMRRALEMEGTVSGEHAIGIGKKEGLKEEVGEEVVDVMRRVKRAVDGKGIMNPGKVFDLS